MSTDKPVGVQTENQDKPSCDCQAKAQKDYALEKEILLLTKQCEHNVQMLKFINFSFRHFVDDKGLKNKIKKFLKTEVFH